MKIIHPSLGAFEITTKLGEGGFATVYQGVRDGENFQAAFKVFKSDEKINQELNDINNENGNNSNLQKECNCEDDLTIKSNILNSQEIFEQETNFMKKVNSPFIVGFYDAFEYNGNNVIIMEYVNGENSLQRINNHGPIPESKLRVIFFEIIQAIKHLNRDLGIVHRDLKCENIMLDCCGNVKLIDFGLAHEITNDMDKPCGSLPYAAPEVILRKNYDEKVDVWSAGIILYALSFAKLPFNGEDSKTLIKKIMESEITFPEDANPLLKDLICKLLNKNPEQRISIDEIENHKWFKFDSRGREYSLNHSLLHKLKGKTVKFIGIDSVSEEGIHKEITPEERIQNVSNSKRILSTLPILLFSLSGSPTSIRTPKTTVIKPIGNTKIGKAPVPRSDKRLGLSKPSLSKEPVSASW